MMKEDYNPIKEEIQKFPQAYPFIAHYWKFHIESKDSENESKPVLYNYGTFNTTCYITNSFYKCISKLFDFNNIENDIQNF